MPAHPIYEGPCKVRVLPAGITSEDLKEDYRLKHGRGLYAPGLYETVREASKRVGLSQVAIHGLLKRGEIPGIVRHGVRAYIPKDWTPDEA